jgi:hypothetical protein
MHDTYPGLLIVEQAALDFTVMTSCWILFDFSTSCDTHFVSGTSADVGTV